MALKIKKRLQKSAYSKTEAGILACQFAFNVIRSLSWIMSTCNWITNNISSDRVFDRYPKRTRSNSDRITNYIMKYLVLYKRGIEKPMNVSNFCTLHKGSYWTMRMSYLQYLLCIECCPANKTDKCSCHKILQGCCKSWIISELIHK